MSQTVTANQLREALDQLRNDEFIKVRPWPCVGEGLARDSNLAHLGTVWRRVDAKRPNGG